MPMDFLRRIEDVKFPLVLHDVADIRNAIVLEAAGLIEAQLPPPGEGAPAVIFRIKPEGRAAISKSKPG
jgi:predicted ArsR family transcriptional regulator